METLTKTKIVKFAGRNGINTFSIDKKGNVRQLVKGDLQTTIFRPVSEKLAEHVCLAAKVIRPALDSTVFRAELKQATKYVAFINGKRV